LKWNAKIDLDEHVGFVTGGIVDWDSIHPLHTALGCKLCFRNRPKCRVDFAAVFANPVASVPRKKVFVAFQATSVTGFGWSQWFIHNVAFMRQKGGRGSNSSS
jgi:hypothetical protein